MSILIPAPPQFIVAGAVNKTSVWGVIVSGAFVYNAYATYNGVQTHSGV